MKIPYKGGVFRVSSRYGYRNIGYGKEFHGGLDLVGESSKILIAISDGVILQSRIVTDRSDLTWQWGNYVCLQADSGERIFYCHLSERLVQSGQRVRVGDPIGIEGSTGYSFGSHCHLEVRNADNKVTALTNTPLFTGIPNIIQMINYDLKEEELPMTAEERKSFEELKSKLADLEKQIGKKEDAERIYHYWTELPKWAHDPIYALYKEGFFAGESPGDLNLSYGTMRTLVVLARAFEKKGYLTY